MKAADTALNELAALEDALAEVEDRIGELRDELKSFTADPNDSDYVPVLLDPSWQYDAAQGELTTLLQRRHTDGAKLRELKSQFESARRSELLKALLSLERKHKTAVVNMLTCAVAFAKAIKECSDIRDSERTLTGAHIGRLYHVGPPLGGWALADSQSFVRFWLAEGLAHGFVTQKQIDEMLA